MWHALRGSDYTLDVDIDKVREAEEVFKECMSDYFLPPEAVAVEPLIPWSPMPGGALTANTQMLRDNGIMEKYPDMIKAMGEVVRRGGYGTSVTPVSQFYFQQAFNNVMFGPWEKIAEPYGQMVLGYFGKTPVPPDPEIVALASKQLEKEPTTRSPLEMNDEDPNKGLEAARKKLQENNLPETDENLFIVATCKDKGLSFLQGKAELGVRKVDKAAQAEVATPPAPNQPAEYTVTVDGKDYFLAFNGNNVVVDGNAYQVSISSRGSAASGEAPAAATGELTPVKAQMPGVLLKRLVQPGDTVRNGQAMFVLEAMKMEVPVSAPRDGVVKDVMVETGQHIANGQELAMLG